MATIIQQVEDRCSEELRTSTNVTDPLLIELYERRKELYNTEQKWRMMAKLGVDCCFEDIHVAPLRRLDRHTMRTALKTVNADVEHLRSVHCVEAQELLDRHIKNTTRDTAPIVVGSYQIRMPPMVGRGDIAIPFLFLEQVYSSAIVFGFCLGRAEKQRDLEKSLALATAMSSFDEGEGGGLLAGSARPLVHFLHADPAHVYRHPLAIANRLAKTVAEEHARALFGDPAELVHQVQTALASATSAQEAQQSLDMGMRSSAVPWLQMSPIGLQRFILEAAAFGRFLWEVELLLEVECGMPSTTQDE